VPTRAAHDCAVRAAAPGHAQEQNGDQSARNILKSVDHRLPLTMIPSAVPLTVDGMDNKANMRDFAGWPVWGWLSPGGIPCPIRVHVQSTSPPTPAVSTFHITPDVGAISFARRAPVANRAHR
jgi:hypothetical protein